MFNLVNKESKKCFKTKTYEEAVKEARLMTMESLVLGNIASRRDYTKTTAENETGIVYSMEIEYTPKGEAPKTIK